MENITPAINLKATTRQDLSAQEFQKMLNYWFNEKGLVSKMRSHLRLQMIDILKNTVIGSNAVETYHPSSLAKQAVNLIIAEYLIQNSYHFSLSIFSTEVSLTNVLPDSTVFEHSKLNPKQSWRFNKENMLNILELIGLSKDSDEFHELLNLYYTNSENNSIMTCIINLLCKMSNEKFKVPLRSIRKCASCPDIKYKNKFMSSISDIFLTTSEPKEIFEKIYHCYSEEKDKIIKEYETHISKYKKELVIKERDIEEAHKSKIIMEEKLNELKYDNKKLKCSIKHLLEHKKLLKEINSVRIDALKEGNNKEKNETKIEEKIIEIEKPCKSKHCDDYCVQTNSLVEALKRENLRLSQINKTQEQDISKLSDKCKMLVKDFESCQAKVHMLNSRLEELTLLQIYEEKGKQSEDVYNLGSPQSLDGLTDEIVQQAKQKLQQLEEESNKIDLRFKNFRIS